MYGRNEDEAGWMAWILEWLDFFGKPANGKGVLVALADGWVSGMDRHGEV
jgi:hypothetical protein